MRTFLDCIPCFLRQALEASRLVSPESAFHERILRMVLREAASMDLSEPPPLMGEKIHKWVQEMSGVRDPYRQIKVRSNEWAMALYPRLRERVLAAADPLEEALRLSIAGNVIDYGALGRLRAEEVEAELRESSAMPIDSETLKEFRLDVERAKWILFLGDNAGEIVLDRLLLEQLPVEKITYVVRGGPVINDATLEDAVSTGLSEMVEVVDSGSRAPGIVPYRCSRELQRRLDRADLIISKGQGNYEGLSHANREVYFLLKAKCDVVAQHLGCSRGDLIFHKGQPSTGVIG